MKQLGKDNTALAKKLTAKEKIMADTFLNSGKTISKTKAVLAAYPNVKPSSAGAVAYQNFNKLHVQAYLANADDESQGVIVKSMQQLTDRRLAFDAAKDIQDRLHGKATQRVEAQSTSVKLMIDLSGQGVPELPQQGSQALDSGV